MAAIKGVADSLEVLAFIALFSTLVLIPIALALGISYFGRNREQVLDPNAVKPPPGRFASLTLSKSGVVLLCLALCLAAWRHKAETLMGLGLAGLAIGGIIWEWFVTRQTNGWVKPICGSAGYPSRTFSAPSGTGATASSTISPSLVERHTTLKQGDRERQKCQKHSLDLVHKGS